MKLFKSRRLRVYPKSKLIFHTGDYGFDSRWNTILLTPTQSREENEDLHQSERGARIVALFSMTEQRNNFLIL